MHIFQGISADDAWLNAARSFEERGESHVQGSRAGDTIEELGTVFEISDPTKRWVISRVPAMNPAFALAEVVWILNGRNDSKFINYWNPKLPKFAGESTEYHGAYGFRLRVAYGMDQLTRAYNALRKNPDSRQIVLQIWDPKLDLPQEDGKPMAPDIPCNICSLLKIRDNRLEWTQVMRSNDLILGTPHNFIQFTMLQEIMAAWLGVDLGNYRHYSDCLHVYLRDWQKLKDVKPVDVVSHQSKLRFTKEESSEQFFDIARRMEAMLSSDLTRKQLVGLVFSSGLNQIMQDWLYVISADCARRHEWWDLSYELGATCSDPILRHLWVKWEERTNKPSKK